MTSYTTYFSGADNRAAQVGTNLGTINFNNQSTPWRSFTPPNPSTVIPYRRDPDFVERDVLRDLWRKASEPGSRVALVGLGGVGKSQVAIEYAYRVRDSDPRTWVFWVHASTATRFKESYRTIATSLRLPGLHEPNADILGMVHGWLSDESRGRWTMIVDNADDCDVLFERWDEGTRRGTAVASTDRSLSEFLPVSPNGSIVVTSRNQEVVSRIQVYNEDVLEVRPMEVDVAKELLLNKVKKGGGKSSVEDVVQLVRQLDCMPLAISQAAAYIDQCAPRITVSRYVEMLEKNDNERDRLLQKDIRDPRRDYQASNSIIMTWHITFTHLRQTRDSAARLLALMSLFDREAIPEYLLRGRYMKAQDNESDFEDDIAALRRYHLISIGVSGDLFDMHRLVQLSTQKWLEIREELIGWQERYIDTIGTFFPTGDYANWETCQALFPHVEAMWMYRVSSVLHRQVWAKVLYNGSSYAWQRGQYYMAENMVRSSLEVSQELFGQDNIQTLECMQLVSLVLRACGKYSEAEKISRQTLAGHEKVLGVDHPHTLSSMSKLAGLLDSQGKYSEAEEMNRRALAERVKVLGADHPDTVSSVSHLAGVLRSQGKYAEAEEMNWQALAGYEKVLGVDHPGTLSSMSSLVWALRNQGKYSEAESMNRRTLAGREKVLGVDHPHTLTSLNDLALVLRDRRKYSEAEEMSRRALAGYEKVLGVDHPDTLASVNNLALVLGDQGKYSEAEEMNRQALTGYEKVLGADHPYTLTSVDNLAQVLRNQGKYSEAEEMSRQALAGIFTRLLVFMNAQSKDIVGFLVQIIPEQ